MHPFLDPTFQVRWSTLTPDTIEPSILQALTEAKENIEKIASQPAAEATYESSFLALEDATETLSRGWGRLHHLDSVSDNPAQREALNKLLPEVTDFYSSLSLNPQLWNVLKTASAGGLHPPSQDPIIQRHIEETLESFKNSGADLPDDKKARIAALDSELSLATKQYAEHVLDSTNAWSLVITDEKKLAGLPDSAKAAAAANAKSKDLPEGSYRFTLQGPSMMPIMQHAHDEELRKTVWQASSAVALEGKFDNTPLVTKILTLRQEKAEILGHQNFADLTLQRRMARNGENALAFVEQVHDRIHARFLEEAEELSRYKASKTGTPTAPLEPWEFSYYAEMQRKEKYDFDDEILRPYFPVHGVMDGMFRIATTIFGITITQKATAPESTIETWHPEVSFYEIHDTATGSHLGSFYADWHPRETKRGGAWMNSLHTGTPGEPHLGLIVGNMSPPVGDKPALLTHREVETIFHEFGHLLHGLLTDVPVKSLAGTNVAWDFVELPSQIMENFCWERQTLDLFARHYETGEPIPEDLFKKLVNAKNYLSATIFMRQLALGKIDLELHVHTEKYLGRDLDEIDREILADYRAPSNTQAPSMIRRFNHLFSSPTGYAAGYYSYKWAEVLDADAFTRFKNEGILNPETGAAFRTEILSKGNSAPPEVLYENFMSRPADPLPLLTRAGLA
ncbi:MAG: M3 family metallopeptidase [Akkermansiaceae bacterium]|nr:M3 family metallopeptidase [Akkermansiaceae bacterium]MDP4896756.1 M3 family metallopeptidase [Akkermansiaceae bacterium]